MRMALNEIQVMRSEGEKDRIKFQPDVHPGIIKRLSLAGFTRDQCAAALGIAPKTLEGWVHRHEEVRDAIRWGTHLADAEVMQSIYDLATGWIDEKTGRRKGAQAAAAIFWAKNRLGMRSEPLPPGPGDNKPDDSQAATAEALAQTAKALVRLMEAQGESAPVLINADAVEVDENEFEEFD